MRTASFLRDNDGPTITALRNEQGKIIGYLLIGTDNSVRKRVEIVFPVAEKISELWAAQLFFRYDSLSPTDS